MSLIKPAQSAKTVENGKASKSGRSGRSEVSFVFWFSVVALALVGFAVVMVLYKPKGVSLAVDEEMVNEQLTKRREARSLFVKPEDRGFSDKAPLEEAKPFAETAAVQPGKGPIPEIMDVVTLIDSGKPQEAQQLLEQIIAKDPHHEQALIELGMLHLIDFKAPEAALPYLEKALRVNPSNRIALSEIMGVYEELGNVDGGMNFLSELYQSHPENGALALGIGQMYASQGRAEEAVAFLSKAADSQDQQDYTLTDIADTYSELGYGDEALTFRKRAEEQELIRLQNSDSSLPKEVRNERFYAAGLNTARELIKLGKLDEAEEKLNFMRANLPNDESLLSMLRQIREQRGG